MAKIKAGMMRPNGREAPKTVRDLKDFDPYDLDEYLHKDTEQLKSHRIVRNKKSNLP